MIDLYGCSDHSCIFGHQGGMGTNGGCSCEKTLQRNGHQKAARQIRLLRSEVTRLRQALEAIAPPESPIPPLTEEGAFSVARKALAAAQEGE